jgi:hypothetical protein
VDDAWDKGFPTHFGTGTEDYYGWAGGEIPTRKDEFSTPFLANARVGVAVPATAQGVFTGTAPLRAGPDATVPVKITLRVEGTPVTDSGDAEVRVGVDF